MSSRSLSDRVETLVNELIEEGGLDSAALASILVAAKDSVDQGYCMQLSRWVWLAASELKSQDQETMNPTPSIPL
jgi:hypothetical protein